jgi:hypothetical protein
MNYADAFKTLGYKLQNHQTDWSAEKTDGVCISMWRERLTRKSPLHFDTDEAWPDGEPATNKIGFNKRTRHIETACEKFDGFVDVVLRDGAYGEQHGDSEPWNWKHRGGRWKITRFDPSSGKFRAEVVALGNEAN